MRTLMIEEVTLSDKSKVYNVIILGKVELACEDLDKAVKLHAKLNKVINELSISTSYPASISGRIVG